MTRGGPSDSVQGRWPRIGSPVGSGELEERMIVTYRNEVDGRVLVLEGCGNTQADALAAADARLPRGTWRRLTCSTVHSIYRDLENDGRVIATARGNWKYNKTGHDHRGARFLDACRARGEGGSVVVPSFAIAIAAHPSFDLGVLVSSRHIFLALLFGLLFVFALMAARGAAGDEPPVTTTETTTTTELVPDPFSLYADALERENAKLRNKLKREHARYLQARRRARHLVRTLAHAPTTREAIDLACSIYGSCSTLWRRAQCESHLYPFARNRYSDASGLFQFLPSTWRSTPFAAFSVWSPYANALAAGWMQANGRGGEWVCR